MSKIIITINPKTGEVKKEMVGFQGPECQEKGAALDASLGLTGSACKLSPEFYEAKGQAENEQQIGGS